MGITYEEAYSHTDPNASEEERHQSALSIQNSVAANDIYWQQHTDQLTALKAIHQGHGQVVSHHDEGEAAGLEAGDSVEGTAVDEGETPADALTTGDSTTSGDEGVVTNEELGHKLAATTEQPSDQGPPVDPSPANPLGAVATLRQQLRNAGLNPEA